MLINKKKLVEQNSRLRTTGTVCAGLASIFEGYELIMNVKIFEGSGT